MKELNNIKPFITNRETTSIYKQHNVFSSNKSFDDLDICKIPKKRIITPGVSSGIIYNTKIKNKKYILKSTPLILTNVRGKPVPDIEYDIYKILNTKIVDDYILQYYCKCYLITRCSNKHTYYLLEKIDGDIHSILYKKTILIQILLAIYYLNHICNIYHCDLTYYKDLVTFEPIRLNNIMYNKIKKPITYTYNLDKDIKIKITISKYLVKLIDFGVSKKNHNLLKLKLNRIYNNFPYISEVLYILYIYLYIKVPHKYKKQFQIKFKIFLDHIINMYNPTNSKEFDSYLIQTIYESNIL
jgi:hypothetical protein